MSRDRVSIKGTSSGVIVTIGAGDWPLILVHLAQSLDQRSSFFKGGRVALNVGDRLLDAPSIEAAGQLLTDHQMTLWAVSSSATETCEAAQSLGLETETQQPVRSAEPAAEEASTITVTRTLRSGQSVEHNGNVIIIGDVNPGAEVIAGGFVMIWGRLRGTVRAGAVSMDGAFVCALEFSPMQLSIGSILARSPAEDRRDQIVPEMAFVQDGRIVAEAWR